MGFSIVTGAAGGMGAPSARRLAERGDTVLLCDLHDDALERVAAPLRAQGAMIETLAGSVADADFPERLLTAIDERRIDALIHTAGVSPSLASGPQIFAINYLATEKLIDAVRPRMADGGCAVLISSSSAYMFSTPEIEAALKVLVEERDAGPIQGMTETANMAYPISKKAVIRLVAREALPFAKMGARIASIAPGFIDTAMGQSEMKASQQMASLVARTPLGRMGSGDEIASVALFLCSPAASYVSGCDIKVDGGALAELGFL